jgi:putative hydrolase of the HAD superfamily
MSAPPIAALLFDLGGVLVDIDFSRALAAWAPYSRQDVSTLRSRFSFDGEYERHERGEITAAQYFEHLARVLDLDASAQQVEAGWNSIFVGEFEATRRLVERLRTVLPCFAFTNTNGSHMETWSRLFPEVVGAFDRIFASHQMGLRKPERAAFDAIRVRTGIAASSFLFFDDLPENVQAAQAAGLQAVLVKSHRDVAAALEAHGVRASHGEV